MTRTMRLAVIAVLLVLVLPGTLMELNPSQWKGALERPSFLVPLYNHALRGGVVLARDLGAVPPQTQLSMLLFTGMGLLALMGMAASLPRPTSPLGQARRWGRRGWSSAAIARRTGLPQDSVRDMVLAEQLRVAEKASGRAFRAEEMTGRLRARLHRSLQVLSVFRKAP